MNGSLFAYLWSKFASCFGKSNRTDVPPPRGASPVDRHGGTASAPSQSALLETEVIVDQLRAAVRHCNMGNDDPIMPLITAFVHAIRHIGARTAASDRVAQESSNAIIGALLQAKKVTDGEIERIMFSVSATESDRIQRVGDAIARSADGALTRRVRVYDRNTALLAALILFMIASIACGCGFLLGEKVAYADVHETQHEMSNLFGERIDDTKEAIRLLRWNPMIASLAECTKPGRISVQDGRKSCSVQLWIEDSIPAVKP